MALVNDHVTDASEKRLGGTGAESGSTQVAPRHSGTQASSGATQARSGGSAQGQDLDFITKNNKLDAEYQLPVTADAKATWVGRVVLQPEPNLPRIHKFLLPSQHLLSLFSSAASCLSLVVVMYRSMLRFTISPLWWELECWVRSHGLCSVSLPV